MSEEFWENFYIMALTVRNHAPDDPTTQRTLEWAQEQLRGIGWDLILDKEGA